MNVNKMMKMTVSLKSYKENNNTTRLQYSIHYLEEQEQEEELDKEFEELEEWLEQDDEEEEQLEEEEPRSRKKVDYI